MKKRIVFTLSLAVIITLLAMPVLANDIPGWLESRWEPDPLQSGAQWWRDTTNQNALAQYYYDTYPQLPHVETIIPGVYVVKGVGKSNAVALVGSTEWVLIDSMESPMNMQLALLLFRPYIGTKPLKALIYTSEDYAHYSGSIIVAPPFSIPVWASKEFIPSLNRRAVAAGAIVPRTLRTTGTMLPQSPDWRIGPATIYGQFSFQYPNRPVSEETALTLAGFNVTLIPAVSATDAGLLVWLPDLKVLIAGDAWSPSFPDIGPLTALGRPAKTWVATLNSMLALNPDYVIPTHGPIISPNGQIQSVLTNYRDAMQYVHDRTLALINTGLTVEDAAVLVQLPEPLASDPYLKQFIADIPSAVKSIAQQYIGWFNGEPPELASSLTTARQAEIMIELAGGIDNMLNTANNTEVTAQNLGSAEKALLMAWAAYRVAPDNILAKRIYAQALKKNAYMQQSNQIRNYYLSLAHTIGGDLPPVIGVSIDIKPGSDTNSINLGSKGVVLVAVLTTPDFNTSSINPETVRFAGAAPEKWIFEDVDGDGDFDLLFQFDTEKLNLTESSTQATLTGQTADGLEITGTDSVKIVPVKGKK